MNSSGHVFCCLGSEGFQTAAPNIAKQINSTFPLSAMMFCSLQLLPISVMAQTITPDEVSAEQPVTTEEPKNTIVVIGERIKGGSLSEFEPELTLNEEDIAAYGASSIGELIPLLLAETSSGRGRANGPPVLLLNGRRISGFREIGRYPVEALARVEVLPEEASLQYGFSADQRVLNFILKPKITVTAFEAGMSQPQEGGSTSLEGSAQRLFVDGGTRFSLDAQASVRPAILEAERDVVGGNLSSSEFRTLSAERKAWNVGFSAGRDIWGGASATVSGSFRRTLESDLLGLDGFEPGMINNQKRRFDDANLGLSIISPMAASTWTVTSNYNMSNSRSETSFSAIDQNGSVVRTKRFTSSRQREFDIGFLHNAPIADLSGGRVTISSQAGFEHLRQTAVIDDRTDSSASGASRNKVTGRFSINAPIIAPGPLPGDFNLNGNIQIDGLSDFGVLTTYGYGLTWRPFDKVRIIASFTVEEAAPELANVNDPIIVTPAVRLFDFASQTDNFVEIIEGGNPGLPKDDRRVTKIGLQLGPIDDARLRFNIDYTDSKIRGETRIFGLLTEEFEQAFPDRVLRDSIGNLTSFDRRPVVVRETRRRELRSAINWTQNIKAQRVRQSGSKPKKRLRSGRPGSLRISAYHRWTLQDQVTIADGIAQFDFLNGSASGRLGGTPEHIVNLSAYRWNNGLGMSANVNYQSGSFINNAAGRLSFSDLLTANVGLSYEFNYADSILDKLPWLEETSITIGVNNIFDDKIQVKNMRGDTPASFQKDILDPFGRTFRLKIRKRF